MDKKPENPNEETGICLVHFWYLRELRPQYGPGFNSRWPPRLSHGFFGPGPRRIRGLSRDVMSHSFGEGYATRSDEEGFGGTYGGNQTFQKDNNDKVHENHPDYDKTQGSEAKEKQKARNQT
ncbi:BnaC02g43990D [Brassica napus]|uniref:(rape) hypothetical protein n=1 Tax=Brassica napus TaxID=3708 RepID=A0A078IG04_BRANA|nr:unnamed protein product [Brassica napus]CDY49840.1 BnaC02g43990D [Brassica napus]